jgi:molecular chaperone IbpA
VKVVGAKLVNGLLTIELQLEVPEEKKARAIPVVNGGEKPALTY